MALCIHRGLCKKIIQYDNILQFGSAIIPENEIKQVQMRRDLPCVPSLTFSWRAQHASDYASDYAFRQ